jgi:outer membrane biosynthesis protein TonB
MKLITLALFLFSCFFYSAQPEAHSASAQGQVIKHQNSTDETESEKRIRECEEPDRVKPNVDTRRVSQLCGKAISLPKPPYPAEAKAKHVSGIVVVEIVTDEEGKVIWARAIRGPELLRGVSEKAACRAQYSPTLISGHAVRTETTLQYYFASQ